MTRTTQPVRTNISEFDADFERTLRRKRKVPEPVESSSSSECESEFEDEKDEEVMAVDNRTIKELSASGLDNATPLCIQYPMAAVGKTDEFELKSSLLHHIPKYHGLSMEDPNKHLKEFEVVCSSMTPIIVDGNIMKMKAFPFSLAERAKDWLYELAPGTVTSWESMKRAFLEKFFPTSRVILLRKKISGIQQDHGESYPAYYERFKALVASCPQHQMKEELLIQYFYEGLLPIERQMLDASAGGALVDKTPVAAKILIANRALNAQQYEGVGQRDMPRHQQVNEVSSMPDIQTQLANLTLLVSQVVEGCKVQPPKECGVCSMQSHTSDKCPQLIENGGWESVQAMGFQGTNQQRNDPYSNTYNPGWRDHPNFRWRDEQQPAQPSGFRQPPGFYQRPMASQPPPQAQSSQTNSGSSIDNDQIFKLLTSMAQSMQTRDKKVDELEKQVGQIAEFMGQFREQGKLPSTTVVNPKGGFETAKAITLRSGKEVGIDAQETTQNKEDAVQVTEKEQQPLTQPLKAQTPPKPSKSTGVSINPSSSSCIPLNVPFPGRFMQEKKDEEDEDILETFRKVQVNIPLLDAIKQIPKYAKFLKKLCTTRKRIRAKEVVQVSENVSAVLQRKLPPKCKDPGSFTIPCVIGNTKFNHAMLDLGASINVMPYSIYASMNLGELKNDGVVIQLADRSNAYPKGVLEDVLVQVDHLIFPADFYVLDMEDSANAPPSSLLLGRPFMKTAHTKIDVAKGSLTMEFGGDTINFKVDDASEGSKDVRACFAINVIQNKRQEHSSQSKKDASRATTSTSLQHNGKSPHPIPSPISTNRCLPSFVQVPKRIQKGGIVHINYRAFKALVKKNRFSHPFIDPKHKKA